VIIDTTDFVNRPFKVPNQEESKDFKEFIEAQEADLGRNFLLGQALYAEFAAAIAAGGTLDAKWEALKTGATYTYNDVLYRYGGWVDLVRPYIYSEWLPVATFKLTNVGVIVNGTPQQSNIKNQGPFIDDALAKFFSKLGDCYYQINTFYGFMKANEADYTDWEFCKPHFKNTFDL